MAHTLDSTQQGVEHYVDLGQQSANNKHSQPVLPLSGQTSEAMVGSNPVTHTVLSLSLPCYTLTVSRWQAMVSDSQRLCKH